MPGNGDKTKKCPCEVKIHIETKGKSKYLDQGRKEKSWLYGGCAFASWRLFCPLNTPLNAF